MQRLIRRSHWTSNPEMKAFSLMQPCWLWHKSLYIYGCKSGPYLFVLFNITRSFHPLSSVFSHAISERKKKKIIKCIYNLHLLILTGFFQLWYSPSTQLFLRFIIFPEKQFKQLKGKALGWYYKNIKSVLFWKNGTIGLLLTQKLRYLLCMGVGSHSYLEV